LALRDQFRRLARYNRWANVRLFGAVRQLSAEDFRAPRCGFFGSLSGTLNHLYVGDRCWLARFEGTPIPHQRLDEVPHPLFDHLWEARRVEDHRILRLMDEASEKWLGSELRYKSMANGQDLALPMDLAVLHFFNHQTHHRAQAHTMLSGTDVLPPPLDISFFHGEDPGR
jgi:uncharacterized damage-inducible protein DinB